MGQSHTRLSLDTQSKTFSTKLKQKRGKDSTTGNHQTWLQDSSNFTSKEKRVIENRESKHLTVFKPSRKIGESTVKDESKGRRVVGEPLGCLLNCSFSQGLQPQWGDPKELKTLELGNQEISEPLRHYGGFFIIDIHVNHVEKNNKWYPSDKTLYHQE